MTVYREATIKINHPEKNTFSYGIAENVTDYIEVCRAERYNCYLNYIVVKALCIVGLYVTYINRNETPFHGRFSKQ